MSRPLGSARQRTKGAKMRIKLTTLCVAAAVSVAGLMGSALSASADTGTTTMTSASISHTQIVPMTTTCKLTGGSLELDSSSNASVKIRNHAGMTTYLRPGQKSWCLAGFGDVDTFYTSWNCSMYTPFLWFWAPEWTGTHTIGIGNWVHITGKYVCH